ncbi:Glyoxalase/bleomycin resistance protein/dioxygenase [Anaeromyxobacter sp. K]|uniref:VOC family protein n=1 Tax=Anaeromyxobacter sp. (strain K) TaxID=447217 RepID=UPI00015F9C47|nr:VOC family protein [Anaeromyxobacter sp. K]ACG71267.1 Glyoxalase/bleomycin resistance protein/dioxygenase [Anaeromyxobacter sp. K]
MTALQSIRQLDYTVLFARDPERMRRFYAEVMGFPIARELGPGWVEFRVGSNLLVLTQRGGLFHDPPTPEGALSVQLAFRVAPAAVAACAEELRRLEVPIVSPPTDQPWGHRTLFFRDPDGNVLEIYADL